MWHYTILIIDDKRKQIREIERKIEALYPTSHADVVSDASCVLEGTYDAYLSDLITPVYSGVGIGNMIYKGNPDAIIIFMSSLDNFVIRRIQRFSALTSLPKSKPDRGFLPPFQRLEHCLSYISIRIHAEEGEKSIVVSIYKIHRVGAIKK